MLLVLNPVLETLFKEERCQVAHGPTFLVAPLDQCLKGGVRDRDRNSLGCSGRQFCRVASVGMHEEGALRYRDRTVPAPGLGFSQKILVDSIIRILRTAGLAT